MFDPLRVHGVRPGSRVGIIGLGGLGQMGVRIAKCMGAEVTCVSRAESKAPFARECGADIFIASGSAPAMAAGAGSLDLILNTVPSYHDYMVYQPLLKPTGVQVLLSLLYELYYRQHHCGCRCCWACTRASRAP